jgi:membrane fusion protein, multidrug efflux system
MNTTVKNRLIAPGRLFVCIITVITIGIFFGCGKKTDNKGGKAEMPAQSDKSGQTGMSGQRATEVSVITVSPKDIPITLETTGKTESYREVEVRTQVTGTLLKRFYVEGTIVKKGEMLFHIDPVPFQTSVDQAKANVSQRQASVSKADRDIERLKPLLAEKAVSQQEYDDALSAREQAQAALEQAVAALRQAEINLNYTKITAPISGIIGKTLKDEGSIVTVGSDSLLAKIHQIDPIYVNYSISDTDYLTTRRQLENKDIIVPDNGKFDLTLTLSDGSIYPKTGKLNYRDTLIDAQTGTIQNRAEFSNPDSILMPNQFVRITMKGAVRPNTITVPQRAVQQDKTGHYLYLVNKDGKVEQRTVEVGDWINDNWVIKSGLSSGDTVIVDGTIKIQPGAMVKTTPIPDASTGSAAPAAPAAPGTDTMPAASAAKASR